MHILEKSLVGSSPEASRAPRTVTSKKLLLAASIGALTIAAPQLAHAQAMPAGCTPSPATNGDTITCLAPPTPIDEISSNVDDLTINVGNAGTPTGVVSAAGTGISMIGGGSQTVNIYNSSSYVNGGGGDGLYIRTLAGGTDLTISSEGQITGASHGIVADNFGAGDVTINVVGVAGNPNDGMAISNSTAGVNLRVTATGAVTGGDDGIVADNNGTGEVRVNATSVDGTNGDGILVTNTNAASVGDLTIVATGTVSGGARGIFADNDGTRSISINAATVNGGAAFDGILAENSVNGDSLSITTTGLVTGGDDGLIARNYGTGALTLDLAGVTGTNGDGVRALHDNAAATGDLSITSSGPIIAGADGVNADNDGTGALTINTAAVTSGAGFDGITANNAAPGTNLSITSTGTVAGGTFGVEARNYGSGVTSIDVADVTATTSDAVIVRGYGTNVSIASSGTIMGGFNGIETRNFGSGTMNINVGAVSGAGNFGIYAYSDASTSGLSITSTGAVSGATGGVFAINNGGGDTIINTAQVDGNGAVNDGVFVRNAATGGSMSITSTGTVSGGDDGVDARNYGSGALTVNTAAATGTSGDGVYAINDTAGTNLMISAAGDLMGGNAGITAANLGSGSTTINVGAVSGAGNRGIYAYNDASTTGLSITSTGAVSGATGGIVANNLGSGVTTITLGPSASVTGQGGAGVLADTTNAAATIVVQGSSGSIVGSTDGVDLGTAGAEIIVDDLDSITGQSGDGVDADSQGGAIRVTDVDAILGTGGNGVLADSNGGDISVQGSGLVGDIEGTSGAGILADASGGGGGDINIGGTAVNGDISGSTDGISATTNGTGDISITVANLVSGGSGIGISTTAPNGASITVNSGGSVTGGTDAINATGGGSDILTINMGGAVNGDALLGAGDDTFADAGGTYTNIFGGAGSDTVNFSGAGKSINGSGAASDALQEFEVFNFNSGGFDLAGAHVGLDEANFLSGENTLSGSLEATTATIADGATLIANDGAAVTGDVVNNGLLDLADTNIGTLTINGDYTQSSTGVLNVNINGADNDLIVASGDVNLDGGLVFTSLVGLAPGTSTYTLVDGGGALIGTFSTVSGLLIQQDVSYDTTNSDVLLTVTVNQIDEVNGLNINQSNVGENLINLLSEPSLAPELTALIGAVGSLTTDAEVIAALQELHPEALDVGLKFLATSQHDFIDLIMRSSMDGGFSGPVQVASLAGGPVSVSKKDGPNVWAAFQAAGYDQSSDAENIGFDGRTFDFAAGVSGIGRGPVTFGLAGGYSDFSGDGDGVLGDSLDAEVFRIALSLRADVNGGGAKGVKGHVDSVIAYADGDADFTMNLIDPVTMAATSQSGSADISSIDWRTRFTIDGKDGRDWAVKPHLQAGVSAYDQDATTIGTSGATSLALEDVNSTRANIGVGATFDHALGQNMNLRARATGVHYFGDTQNVFSSRFAAAPTGSAAFRTFGKEVRRQVELEAALSYAHKSGITLGVGAFGEVGDLTVYGGNISVSKQF